MNGAVYWDPEVNYWLYGVWARLVGASYSWALLKVTVHASTTKEGAAGKISWFEAGYSGLFAKAEDSAIRGVEPALAPPKGEDTGALKWYVGSPPGHFNGSD